jgi:hypothetical protein
MLSSLAQDRAERKTRCTFIDGMLAFDEVLWSGREG